jgi:CRP-like cAMP-binding protein
MDKTTSGLESLRSLVFGISPLPENDWIALVDLFEPFSARRKVILTEAGEEEKYLYFVLEGVQRVYSIDASGREATLVFTYPPSFGGVLDAMMLQQPSRYYFETLTVSKFLRAPVAGLLSLADRPAVSEFLRKGLSVSISGLLLRLGEMQTFSSEEKYRSLLARSPHILQLVPHKYLANYIGIDPTNFSKLINSVQI